MDFAGLVVAQDVTTATCGALNGAYFVDYWWQRELSRGRRLAAAAMAGISTATVVEAFFSQGAFWSQRGVLTFGEDAYGLWALLRLPLLLATLFVSLLIVRRLVS